MKTCLLISGLARNVEESFSNIKSSLIDTNNPDIFIHTWVDQEKQPGLDKKIIDLYNPKKIIIEERKCFKNSMLNMERMMASYAKPFQRDNFLEMIYSSWYSIQQSNLLKEQYRLENNIIYDYSIRARFDINYNIPIDCSKYDKNIIHVSKRDVPLEMIDDRFAFASDDIMNVYCGIFNTIDFIHKKRDSKDGIFCGETLVYEILNMFNINYSKIPSLHCIHIR